MNASGTKSDRYIGITIVVLSVMGVLYFGARAIQDNFRRTQFNPYEYSLEPYTRSGADAFHYAEVARIPVKLQSVSGITVGSDNTIYVAGGDSVVTFGPDGSLRTAFTAGRVLRCLAVDSSATLYLGADDHIEVYDNDGRQRARWQSPGGDALITSIALWHTDVYCADAGNRVVWRYDTSGTKLGRIGEVDEAREIPGFLIPSPYFDIAFDPDGFLWAANTGRHSLENYTREGDLRTAWGEYSMNVEGFCGCCNPTHLLILNDGRFVTSEKGIPRVKIHNRLGKFVSLVAGPDQFVEGTVGLDLAVDTKGRIHLLDPAQRAVRIFDVRD